MNDTVVTSPSPLHIREMIEHVLFTMPGERVMYPAFGVGLEDAKRTKLTVRGVHARATAVGDGEILVLGGAAGGSERAANA